MAALREHTSHRRSVRWDRKSNRTAEAWHRELLQGRSASDGVCHRGRDDSDYSDSDDNSDVELDGQLSTTAATVVATENCMREHSKGFRPPTSTPGGDRRDFDVVGSTRHQAVCSSDRYLMMMMMMMRFFRCCLTLLDENNVVTSQMMTYNTTRLLHPTKPYSNNFPRGNFLVGET